LSPYGYEDAEIVVYCSPWFKAMDES
jgi:hypothetical protein